jgi:hypothetical protein
MSRLITISVLGFIAAVAANAGAIQIGGASGVTNNYITQGAGAVCNAGAGNCVVGTTNSGAFIEKEYDAVLFANATESGTPPSPYAGYSPTGGNVPGNTVNDATNGVTFSMISDGATVGSNASKDYWSSTGGSSGTVGAAQSMTVPIGVDDVGALWTMLDNQYGSLGGNDTTVTFNFGTTSNAASTTPVVVALTNNNGTNFNGELRSSMSCATTPSTPPGVCSPSTNSHENPLEGVVINGVTVNEGVVFNTNYNTVASGFYANSAGKTKLDDQEFEFGGLLCGAVLCSSDWLVSVTVTENVPNTFASSQTDGQPASETALSAITVETVPEPTTILLLLTGIGGMGLARLRRS